MAPFFWCDFWDGFQTTFINPPSPDLPTGPLKFWPDRSIELTLTAYDPEGDDVDFSIDVLPPGAELDGERGFFEWRPSSTDVGDHELVVTATDIWGFSSSATFTIAVSDEPGPPRQSCERRQP